MKLILNAMQGLFNYQTDEKRKSSFELCFTLLDLYCRVAVPKSPDKCSEKNYSEIFLSKNP